MWRPIIILLAWGMSCCAMGQDNGALLWQVQAGNGSHHGFVYGTVHSRDKRAFSYVRSVVELMPQVHTVAGELDPDEVASGSLALMSAMLLPGGQRITDLYKRKKDRAFVERSITERLGPMAAMFMRMKPFFVMAAMMENNLGTDQPVILDSHLLTVAQEDGRRVIGLETMKEQFDAIDAASLHEQADMLLQHLRDPAQAGDMEALLNAYVDQDLVALQKVADGSGAIPDAMERALIGDRNRVMVHRMDSVMRADTAALFLIGALHLPGDTGVVTLLRERGYRVQAIPLIADALMPRSPSITTPEGTLVAHTDSVQGFRMHMYGEPEWTEDHESTTVTSIANGNAAVVIKEKHRAPGGLDERVAELLAGAQGSPVHVQGVEGRRLAFTDEGREMEFLFLIKDGHLWLVVVGDPDAQRRMLILDSFRFTDLPE